MDVFALILAGGDSPGLSSLADPRPTAAMPFAGKYRIIDFTLSNCTNSGIFDVAVLTQYRPHSLNEHIGNGRPWDLDRTYGGIQIWQPYRGRSDQGWQRGTADALYQNRDFIRAAECDTLLVLSGDHIYKQDYRPLLRRHDETGADVTIPVMHVPREETHRFGIVSLDDQNRIAAFREKPHEFYGTLASMGIYVFRKSLLLEALEQDAHDSASAHEFGRNIIPAMVEANTVYAYPFDGYWTDAGTVQAYWQANLDLLGDAPALNLYDKRWRIHTRSGERPPVKLMEGSTVSSSLLSNGCRIAGRVINSVLSPGVVVEHGAEVRDSVIMNDTRIEAGALVDRCILDKEVVVGGDARLGVGVDSTPNRSEPEYLRMGISIVGKGARIPSGVQIGRNCRIDPGAGHADFPSGEVASGECLEVRV